jgi:hypothetical protein
MRSGAKMFADPDPRDEDGIEDLEGWLEGLGDFGTAARLAIPRLNEFRKHPNPWVRMWASEALTRIMPKANSMTIPSHLTQPVPGALPLRN